MSQEGDLSKWPKITLLGDSITARSFDVDLGGWGAMLAHKVQPFCDVDNRGFDGYNSKWLLELMPKLFPKSYLENVKLFIPFIGHNDSWIQSPLHVDVDDFERNMRKIIEYLLSNGLKSNQIIMVTPTWYHDEETQKFAASFGLPTFSKKLEDAQKYAQIIQSIACDNKIECLDFFKLSCDYDQLDELFCDGVHFSLKGAKYFFNHLWPLVEKSFEQQYDGKKFSSTKELIPNGGLYQVTPVYKLPELEDMVTQMQHSKNQ